jgi:Kef-type K+ transport system membrane component KefB
LWGNAFVILGHAAGPDGQLFRIGVLGVAAYLAGFVVHTIGLPPLLGMLLVGIVLRNTRTVVLSGRYLLLAADLRFVHLTRQASCTFCATKIKRSKYSMTQTGGDVEISVLLAT